MSRQDVRATGCRLSGIGGSESNPARRWKLFLALMGLASVVYLPWLLAWFRFALSDDLASYVLLVPVMSGVMIFMDRGRSPFPSAGAQLPAVLSLIVAGVFALWAWLMSRMSPEAGRHDYLAPAALSFISVVIGCGYFALGRGMIGCHAFALGFLVFAAPLPTAVVNAIEIFFQYTSADVSAWMIDVARIPILRTGLVFQLPGITIQVAQECSGIRSSLVLFIMSVYAGRMILKSVSRRVALALFVIPLAIVRNSFRILTIAALCVHVGPEMIDSPIHHRGGPIFFGLSLIPFFLFLLWLRRGERSRRSTTNSPPAAP